MDVAWLTRQRCLLTLVLQIVCLFVAPVAATSIELMKKYGYPSESHRVTTADGYILTLDRIPPTNRGNSTSEKMPILLLHGMISNAKQFLIAGPRMGLGFICSDAGHDVWLMNFRGTMSSHEHVDKLKPRDYWNFTFTEHGIHDTLTALDFISAETKKPKIHVLGYSMGASSILIALIERPAYNERIQSLILMAPTTAMTHATTPLKSISQYVDSIYRYLLEFRMYYLPMFNLNLLRPFNKRLCTLPNIGLKICRGFLSMFEGFMVPMQNSMMDKVYDTYPDYTSTKALMHYFQHFNTGRFCQFDYGSQGNRQIYNTTTPPDYDLSKINTTTLVICSKKDAFSSIEDNMWLKSKLPRGATVLQVQTPTLFGHLSFTLDAKVDTLVNKHIMKFLENS